MFCTPPHHHSYIIIIAFFITVTQVRHFKECLEPPDSDGDISISWLNNDTAESIICLVSKDGLANCLLPSPPRYNVSLCGKGKNSVSFESINSSNNAELYVAFFRQQELCINTGLSDEECNIYTIIASYKLTNSESYKIMYSYYYV